MSNFTLADLQYEAMKFIGPIEFTEQEKAYAQEINDQYPPEVLEASWEDAKLTKEMWGRPLYGENFPSLDVDKIETGSTDVGDLSWITPVSMLNTACWASGVPGHSWGNTATGAMSIGHKGMMHAAKVMAISAIDLYCDPDLLKKARDEFEAATKGHPYRCPLPDSAKGPRYTPPSQNWPKD